MTTRQSRRSTLNAARRKSRRIERVAKVNDAVEIWWSVDKTFYRGTLTRRHGEDNFRVVYDDGETEDLDLTKEFWRFADDPATQRGTASKDNQDFVEVVLDGSDSLAADSSKQTRKPQRRKDKKPPDDKVPEKKITKQSKASTGDKSAVAKTTPQHAGKNSAPAKRSGDTPAPADQVSDVVAPATSSDTNPSSLTPSRTRAKPKMLKVKTVEKQSTRAKSIITKPNVVPPMQNSTPTPLRPSTRGETGVKAPTPGLPEVATHANGVGKGTPFKNKPVAESKVKAPVPPPNPADSIGVNADNGQGTVAQNGSDKRISAQGGVKMAPAKAIGKMKKSVLPSRPKSARTRATRGKTINLPQDESLSPPGAPAKGVKPIVDELPAAVTPTRKLPIDVTPAPYLLKSTDVRTPKVVPTLSPITLPTPNKEREVDPEVPSERIAPSFAADRKRKRKMRSASLTNRSRPMELSQTPGGTLALNIQPTNKLSADDAMPNKTKQNERSKEASLLDGKVSTGGSAKAPVGGVKPPEESWASAQGPGPKPLQSRRTADFKSHEEDEAENRRKRSRLDQGLASTQKDIDEVEAQAAVKRLRSGASHPPSTAPCKTTDLQFSSVISSEELASMVTKAVSPSQGIIENLRSEVRDMSCAISKMKEEKTLAEQAFQRTVLDSVNQLRTSIQEVKAELLEAVEKKAREAESRATATAERLFNELVEKVVTKGADRESRNIPETTQERTAILTEDGEAHRLRGALPSSVQPREHRNSQNIGDHATRPSDTQPVNGRGEPATAVGNISPEPMNPRSTTLASDPLKEEEDADRHAILKTRVSHLAARQVTVWLLETPHEYDQGSGPVKIWARKVATLIFKKVAEQLMRFDSYIQAYQTLCSSLGNDAVELQWFVSPDTRGHLDRARRNYAAWDPPPTDEEWKSEVWLLNELSQRFTNALKRCDYSSMSDIQACIAVAGMASREEISPNPRFIHYRNTNGVEMDANRGLRADL